MLQTGPRAAVEHRVGAVPQQEHPLQLVQRPVHRARAGEGAVVAALLLLRAAVFLDLRVVVIGGDKDIGKAFVVAQQHVELGLELLDQVLFEQQRLGLGLGRQEHHRGGIRDHPRNARRMPRGPRVGRHPRPQVPRLADVKHAAFRIEHPIDARRGIERLQIGLNHLAALRRRAVVGRVHLRR